MYDKRQDTFADCQEKCYVVIGGKRESFNLNSEKKIIVYLGTVLLETRNSRNC